MDIKQLESEKKWDEFVLNHPQGTFFHQSAWKKLAENVFSFKTYYLETKENGAYTGVLPLVHVKSRLFGNALISTPFCVYGGMLASTENAQLQLLEEAKKLAHQLGVDHLELRNKESSVEEGYSDALYVHFEKVLEKSPEANLQAIPRKQRAMLRKGIKNGLEYKIEKGADNFFRLYSECLRNLGTPVQSKVYYQSLLDYFGAQSDVLTVFYQNQPVCSVLNFYYKNTVLPYYGGGGEKARDLAANDFMYWALMNHALEKGMACFDFGRSKVDSGSYHFKKHWGFVPKPMGYRYIPILKEKKPNLNPNNPKYQFFIKQWQKLPLWFANQLGPHLARSLG